MVFNYILQDKVNVEKLRKKINMFSVNHMNIYQMNITREAFIVKNFGTADNIQKKWLTNNEDLYCNRRKLDVKVPRVDHVKCRGFSWHAANVWNNFPESLKSIKKPETFKNKL